MKRIKKGDILKVKDGECILIGHYLGKIGKSYLIDCNAFGGMMIKVDRSHIIKILGNIFNS